MFSDTFVMDGGEAEAVGFHRTGGGKEVYEDAVREALAAILATDDEPEEDSMHRGVNGRAWQAFCERVVDEQVAPTVVIDFAYADKGGLDLKVRERSQCASVRASVRMCETLVAFKFGHGIKMVWRGAPPPWAPAAAECPWMMHALLLTAHAGW